MMNHRPVTRMMPCVSAVVCLAALALAAYSSAEDAAAAPKSLRVGRFESPGEYMKDFFVYRQGKTFHLFYNVGKADGKQDWMSPGNEECFGHATSEDLNKWKIHERVLPVQGDGWEGKTVSAPSVIRTGNEFTMVYTGFDKKAHGCQRIGLATSPDLFKWSRYANNPIYEGPAWTDWGAGRWANCRDATLFEHKGKYYLFTMVTAKDGGAIAIARSTDLKKWEDLGAAIRGTKGTPESPVVFERQGKFYLIVGADAPGCYMSDDIEKNGWERVADFKYPPPKGSLWSAFEVFKVGDRYIAGAFQWLLNGNHIDFWELKFDGDKPYVVYTEDEATRSRPGSHVVPVAGVKKYADKRPAAKYRLDATDQGVVLRHGDGPNNCDQLGAREALIFEEKGVYHLFYDGAGPKGWLACLATSKDLKTWEKKGPALDFGKPGENDSAGACSPWVYFDGTTWHMFYLGTPHATPPPDLIPGFPYLTLKATSKSLAGPWEKQKVIPFSAKPNTYYSSTASPGHIVKQGREYLMFFSTGTDQPLRTIGLARTTDLNGEWKIAAEPLLPLQEQIENTSLYFEKSNNTWFMFTNHVGVDPGEYTDAVWVYWTKDLSHWNPDHKAVVLDGQNCTWSKKCIGMPSVIQVGNRLAVLYDGPGGDSTSHMGRDIGLAWLNLPLVPPAEKQGD